MTEYEKTARNPHQILSSSSCGIHASISLNNKGKKIKLSWLILIAPPSITLQKLSNLVFFVTNPFTSQNNENGGESTLFPNDYSRLSNSLHCQFRVRFIANDPRIKCFKNFPRAKYEVHFMIFANCMSQEAVQELRSKRFKAHRITITYSFEAVKAITKT